MDMQSNPTDSEGGGYHWLSPLLAAVITFNFAVEAYRSLDRPLAVAFVVSSYSALVLLLWCLRQYVQAEKEESDTVAKEKLAIAILVLPNVLVAMFACRVAAIMTPAGRAALWIVVGLCVASSVYAICDHQSSGDQKQQQPQQRNTGDDHYTYEPSSCSPFGTVNIKIVV